MRRGPQSLIDSAQRDRRWCQGNIQHSLLLLARGMRGRTRVHFLNGILGYLASPLWLLLILLSIVPATAAISPHGGLSIGLLGFTLALLFLPKFLCLADLLADRSRLREFGGFWKALRSVVSETVFSSFVAPVNMMFHSHFVACILLGKKVAWDAQNREATGTSWRAAAWTHKWHTVAGIIGGTGAFLFGGSTLFLLTLPVSLGLAVSIPLSVLTSRPLASNRMFRVPEDGSPPRELTEALAPRPVGSGEPQGQNVFAEMLGNPLWLATHLALSENGAEHHSITPLSDDLKPISDFENFSETEKLAILGNAESFSHSSYRVG